MQPQPPVLWPWPISICARALKGSRGFLSRPRGITYIHTRAHTYTHIYISLMVILFTSLSRAICIRPARLSRAPTARQLSFLIRGLCRFRRLSLSRIYFYRRGSFRMVWTRVVVVNGGSRGNTLARIIRLIRNNGRHSRDTIGSKKVRR